MPARSVKSSRSSRSSGSGRSTGSNVTVTTSDMNMPKQSRAMDAIFFFAGANPKRVRGIRQCVHTNDDTDETWTTYEFVQAGWYDYYNISPDYDDSSSTSSGSSSRSGSRSSRSRSNHSSRRKSRNKKGGDPWKKREVDNESSYSDDDDDNSSVSESVWDDASDADYGAGPVPPPPHFPPNYPMPPQAHPGMARPPPPPPQGGGQPGGQPMFFKIN